MKMMLGLAAMLVGLTSVASADDAEVTAVLDRAIKALGGEAKLAKADVISWKNKGKLYLNGTPNEFEATSTVKGLDRHRAEFKGNFGGQDVEVLAVLDGDKGWRKFDGQTQGLSEQELSTERQNLYLQVVTYNPLALKGKGFKVESKGEEKVDGKPASVLTATGPDGKDFTLSFDKETGLPVKRTAKVVNFDGSTVDEVETFSDYKDYSGLKIPTKVASTRAGSKFVEAETTDFKVLDKADADSFSRPE
ncbi:hypothetical protein EP7_000691 [Isosphaeraceae bacterium EP7]